VIDIGDILRTLAQQRPLFHSEADFQHAFAWEIHRRLPDASVRLEFPFQVGGKSAHLDIWIAQRDTALAIELKYKTRKFSVEFASEKFNLLNQSAQDVGRYDFLKDIQRLEQIVADRPGTVGYAILLTNESLYWRPQKDSSQQDTAFRLHQGRVVYGQLKWQETAGLGSTEGRTNPITLRSEYSLNWEDYSRFNNPMTSFRYLQVVVR